MILLERRFSHAILISKMNHVSSVSSVNSVRIIIAEVKEELIKNICHSREKTLRAESQELLGRMRKKVELLKEDKVDIQTELTDKTTNITTIIETVRSLGNMVDADKLKVKPFQNSNNIALTFKNFVNNSRYILRSLTASPA